MKRGKSERLFLFLIVLKRCILQIPDNRSFFCLLFFSKKSMVKEKYGQAAKSVIFLTKIIVIMSHTRHTT